MFLQFFFTAGVLYKHTNSSIFKALVQTVFWNHVYSLCEECFGAVKLNEKIKTTTGPVMHIHCRSQGKRAMISFKGKLKAINEVEISPVIPKISNIM